MQPICLQRDHPHSHTDTHTHTPHSTQDLEIKHFSRWVEDYFNFMFHFLYADFQACINLLKIGACIFNQQRAPSFSSPGVSHLKWQTHCKTETSWKQHIDCYYFISLELLKSMKNNVIWLIFHLTLFSNINILQDRTSPLPHSLTNQESELKTPGQWKGG